MTCGSRTGERFHVVVGASFTGECIARTVMGLMATWTAGDAAGAHGVARARISFVTVRALVVPTLSE